LVETLRAHYHLLTGLYVTERVDKAGYTLISGGEVEDPEWNHAGLLRLPPEAVSGALEAIAGWFKARGRPSVVAISPATRPVALGEQLASRGWRPVFRHRWLTWTGPLLPAPLPPAVTIQPVTDAADQDAFLAVFTATYGGEDLTGYATAFARGGAPPSGVRIVYVLARINGVPAGVATVAAWRGTAGLYNLAVHPRFRRRGLGAALTRWRIAWAHESGCNNVFLQTERDTVRRWQQGRGFEPLFEITGMSEA